MSVLPASTEYTHYDFRRPTTLARDQSRALELAFETFGRQWGTQLTAKTRVRSQVAFESVVIRTYDEYARALPPTTAMLLVGIEASASGSRGVVQFPVPAALAWISRMLGGSETDPSGEPLELPERGFTPVEQAIVRRLLDDTVDDLRYSFGAQLPGGVTFDGIQHNSQFAQAAAPADLMIVATFRVTVAERADIATVMLPADAVLPSLAGVPASHDDEDMSGRMRAQLAVVPVEVAVRLTPLPVTAGRVISLAVGDVIRLPHASHKPLDVVVDGVPVARASAGTAGSRLACVVVETQETPR